MSPFSRVGQRIRKTVRERLVATGRGCLLALCWLVSLPAYSGPGAEMYNEFLEKGIIYPDQAWQDYVTEVGERLLAQSPHAGRA